MAKTHKTGKTKLHKGFDIREYSDGSWRYFKGKTGIAIRAPQWENITKENSKEMFLRGRDVIQEKKQAAILRRAKDHLSLEASQRISQPLDVAAEASAELYMEVFEHDNPLRDRVKVYTEIGKDVGFVDKHSGGGGTQAIQVNINISEKAVAGIDKEDEILDGLWEEIDTSRKE
jgi:hypothetical protein